MRTVSHEMAKKLKEAGLKWVSKMGDCYYNELTQQIDIIPPHGLAKSVAWPNIEEQPHYVWLPTLRDLLEWLEEREYWWHLYWWHLNTGKDYEIVLYDRGNRVADFEAGTPEDVVANVVLWILENNSGHFCQVERPRVNTC